MMVFREVFFEICIGRLRSKNSCHFTNKCKAELFGDRPQDSPYLASCCRAVRRLEEAHIIEGFTARLNLRATGYSFEAFVHITVDSHDVLDKWAASHPEVLALHTTTGNHCALIRLALTGPEHLQMLIQSLGTIGKTTTSIVLSSQFESRPRLPGDQLPAVVSSL